MSAPEAQAANLFQMLHEARVAAPVESADSDRRRRDRRSFPTVQSIAPYADDSLPSREQFFEVECHDLSTTGIAYFADEPPKYDRLVVALATSFEVLYLTAAVIHAKPLTVEGQPRRFLVGCRFMGRVQIS